MKNKIYAGILCGLSLQFFNCNSTESQSGNDKNPTTQNEVIEGVSEDFKTNTLAEYKDAFYKALNASKVRNPANLAKASVGEKRLPITLEKISELYRSIDEKMPDFANLTESQLKKIENEINMTREEMVKEQEKVRQYFIAKLRYKLFKKIMEYLQTDNLPAEPLKKTTFSYPGQEEFGLCDDEYWLLFWSPTYIDGTKNASDDAFAWEIEFYGSNGWKTIGDAFRHTVWNVLLAHYNKHENPTRQDAVFWASEFSTAHESCRDNSIYLDSKMDLHNNKIGRDYWFSVSTNRGALSWWGYDSRWVESAPTSTL